MASQANRRFSHRQIEDGSHRSICAACHATVATTKNEEDLRPLEVGHVCDPIRLYQVSEGAVRLPDIPE